MSVDELYRVRKLIIELRDTRKLSWRDIAAEREFSGVSHSTLRDIYNGADPSPETCKALGFQKTPYRSLVFKFYDDAAFEAARAAVDSGGCRVEWLMRMIDKEKDDV